MTEETEEVEYIYRVDEPAGSAGWRPYGQPGQWTGTITTDDPGDQAERIAGIVARDLTASWDMRGVDVHHVRICVWRDEEGEPSDADYTVEIQPDIR